MTDLQQTLTEEIRSFQKTWRDDTLNPALRWFATLTLEEAAVSGDTATFIFHDPADGTQHGWRYAWRKPDEWKALTVYLHEDLATSEPTEPDQNGVRWWGVHQWVDGELIPNRGA